MDRRLVILLAEDDDGHAYLIEEGLRETGLSNPLVRVGDGQAALDYVRAATAPVLVLLDVDLPRVDGAEVLRQLRTDPKTRAVPVVVLTVTDDPREVTRFYDLGCSCYVTKPVERAPFVDAIRRLGLFLAVASVPDGDTA